MLSKVVKSDYFVFILITLIAYFLISNTLFVGFNIEDDHQFISMENPNNIFKDYGGNLSQFIFNQSKWFNAGRFFPLLITIIFLKAKLIGSNYMIQHLIVFFSGVLIAYFAYKIFRLKKVSQLNSVIGALVLYTGSAYGEIYWRLICGEGPGVLFYVIGLYFTLKYFDKNNTSSLWLSALFLTAAALTKESFVLLFPLSYLIPLIGAKSINEVKQIIINNKNIYIIAGSIFTCLMVTIIFMIVSATKIFDYGSSMSIPATIKNNLIYICKWFIPFIPIVLLSLIYVIKNKTYVIAWQIALLVACWLTAHLIIYHKVIISFSMGKYIMPGGLVFIGLLVMSLEYIRINSKLVFKICLILMSFLLIRNGKITYIMANEYAAKVESFNKLVQTMIKNKQANLAIYGGVEIYLSANSQFKINGYFPKIYSTKIIKNNNEPVNIYQNEAFEDAMFATIGVDFPNRTLAEIGKDSTVSTLIIAEPQEVKAIDEAIVRKYFPNKTVISTPYNNPKFSDMVNSATWRGVLNNSSVSYLYFTK